MAGMEIGSIVRTQDFTIIKQNEDNKANLDQINIGQNVTRQKEANATDVVSSQNADYYNKKQDASEKGNNTYGGDGGRKRRDGFQEKSKDRVVKKTIATGFDMKI